MTIELTSTNTGDETEDTVRMLHWKLESRQSWESLLLNYEDNWFTLKVLLKSQWWWLLSWCKGCHIGDKGDGDVGQYTDDDHDSYLQGEC